jgi:D-beta-D-heptose 7-phosphate kinase/D-beta-D-heptose 1-phosphate adenosyltransferase
MVKLLGAFSFFKRVRVGVIGDLMHDIYTTGKIKRISPEAPVSILHAQKEEHKPGGAGNVVLNLISLGAEVVTVGRVGLDSAGEKILTLLKEEESSVEGIMVQPGFRTPVKNRFIADAQQVLRVDFEKIEPITEEAEQWVVEKIPYLFSHVQVIAISDYGKGFLSKSLLMAVIEFARERAIPVIVDPKGDDFAKYSGATILKPNLQEAYTAAKLSQDTPLEFVAQEIFKKTSNITYLMITRSEAGISLFTQAGEHFEFPARSKEIKDVTGAGDTVLAMITIALASGLDIKSSLQLANIAAGIAIERLGCARIDLADMSHRLLEFDLDNKIFDEKHLFALQQALKDKRYFILGLHSTQGMSTALFKSIRSLSWQKPNTKLIIYIRDSDPEEEFISLLSSLAEVDFVVLKCESLRNLCGVIQPEQIFSMEDNRLIRLDHFQDLISLPLGNT